MQRLNVRPVHARSLAISVALSCLLSSPVLLAGPPTGPISDTLGRPATAVPGDAQREHRRRLPAKGARLAQTPLAGGSLILRGEIAGDWDFVDGSVVFSYDFTPEFPDVGELQLPVRSFSATREGSSDFYTVSWDRAAYWLDFDGDGPEVPRLLPALQLADAYVPTVIDDPFPEFASNPDVQDSCVPSAPCTVQLSSLILLREPGVDYSNYPDGAANVDLLFVATELGSAIAGVLDVYDENDEYVETKDLVEDDELQFSVTGYKLGEPGFIYLVPFTDFVALQPELRIELDNYIPGVDFADPRLPPDLNAGGRRMMLLMDANLTVNDVTTWAYGGPFDLGYTWSEVLDFLHADGFESLQPTSIAAPAMVKRRSTGSSE